MAFAWIRSRPARTTLRCSRGALGKRASCPPRHGRCWCAEGSGPTLRLSLARAFAQRVQLAGRESVPVLLASIRPADVETVDDGRAGQAEMDAQIVLRQVTAAAAHFLPLLRARRRDVDARADRAAIRRGAD